MMAAAKTAARDLAAEVAFLTRALKAPTLRESVGRLAERARAESWTHEEFLIACLQREVAARDAHGGEGRIRAARFPARKSLEEFDFDHSRGLKREVIAHLGTLDFVTARDNVVFLGPPGTGKTHLAIGLAIRACQAGHRVLFATASEWVARLADAHQAGRLQTELIRLGRYPLLVVDEVGYIPFEPEAANLFFQLVSSRYERASLIVTSNKPFGRWGEVFGDDVVAAAMIDRLVHHAEVIALKGDLPPPRPRPRPRPRGRDNRRLKINWHAGGQLSAVARAKIQAPLTSVFMCRRHPRTRWYGRSAAMRLKRVEGWREGEFRISPLACRRPWRDASSMATLRGRPWRGANPTGASHAVDVSWGGVRARALAAIFGWGAGWRSTGQVC